MVDVGAKPATQREAVAECRVRLSPASVTAIANSQLSKGDALAVARLAGIMGAKRTSELIPLCHPLPLSSVEVKLELEESAVRIEATARVTGQTGVEMEALTAAAVAGLALIDMVKSLEKGVELQSVRLLRKAGGRSGEWTRQAG
ncbi:MAG: cyclic pyranopterin monophosphate synthase MoaC [Candidatus Dormibacteraeota bacterium]|nr:cyclic pyranopterin monophosphate synthase MoaC [Candidatus Dormibacteraeota bacterium]